MKISIIGAGYVGLVTGLGFAKNGHEVIFIDTDMSKIEKLRKKIPPFYEPGLEELLNQLVDAERIQFFTEFNLVATTEICFICVGTPSDGSGRCDTSYAVDAFRRVASTVNALRHPPKFDFPIVLKSTVPPTELKNFPQYEGIELCCNPEFLSEGNALSDVLFPARIVLGVNSKTSYQKLLQVYKEWKETPIFHVTPEQACMIKYASNCFLATKISYANYIAQICEELEMNPVGVLKAVGADPRIGQDMLHSGIGYGGSCFPKDIKAMKKFSQDLDVTQGLLQRVELINEQAQHRAVARILSHCTQEDRILIYGVGFKPRTDDVRESPMFRIIRSLLALNYNVFIYDPLAGSNFLRAFAESSLRLVDRLGLLKEEPTELTFKLAVINTYETQGYYDAVPQWILDRSELLYDCSHYMVRRHIEFPKDKLI